MRTIALVIVSLVCLSVANPTTATPTPAISSSLAKAVMKFFGKEGAEEASEYLAKQGSKEMLERVSSAAAKQGGDEAVEQVAKMTGKYGPDAVAALDNAPSIMPVLRALDELPETQVKDALARLAAGTTGRELAETVAKHGGAALRSEVLHPGVGMLLVRSLGDDGAELAVQLSNKQAIEVARHADDIAKLPKTQRDGVLAMIRNDSDRMVKFIGKFVEENPKATLFSVAATTVILAQPERILGGDKIVYDADGNPVVVSQPGLAGRSMDAGGAIMEHASENYLQPVYYTVMIFVGVFVVCWLAIKYWQFRKLGSIARLKR